MLRDDVGLPTIYRRIYRRKFLTLSNQTSRYIRKCIRMAFFFIVSSEISVYLMKIKVVSITSELISYHFTIVNDTFYIFTLRFGRLRFSSLFQKWMLHPLQIFEHL